MLTTHTPGAGCVPATDRDGVELGIGARIKYHVYQNDAAVKHHGGKKTRMGTVLTNCTLGKFIDVVLDGDPFGTYCVYDRIEFTGAYNVDHPLITERAKYIRVPTAPLTRSNEGTMAVRTKPSTKELRREAKSLKITNWDAMDADELSTAIRDHKRSNKGETKVATKSSKKSTKSAEAPVKSKKASTKTKAAATEEVAENGNPYKVGSNQYLFAEQLIKGGSRSKMVKALTRQVELKPRKNVDDFDVDAELDRRLLLVGQNLRNEHGFEVTREGRGSDATIVAKPGK